MDTIEIVNYESAYKEVFRDLNVEWISTYFKMEASDYKALEHADSHILQNGGYILGAKTLYLESNTILTPAISLYRKLGFVEVFGRTSPYERCNIQMALVL